MTVLSNELVREVRNSPRPVQFEGETFTLRGSSAREGQLIAELELVSGDGNVLGYITAYGDNERGATSARFFGIGLPVLFRRLDDAIAHIHSDYR